MRSCTKGLQSRLVFIGGSSRASSPFHTLVTREHTREGQLFPFPASRSRLLSRDLSRYPPNSGLACRLSRRRYVGLATRRVGSKSRTVPLTPWSESCPYPRTTGRNAALTPWAPGPIPTLNHWIHGLSPSPTACSSGPSPTLTPWPPWSESRPDPWLEFCFSILVFNASAICVNSLLIFVPPVEEDG